MDPLAPRIAAAGFGFGAAVGLQPTSPRPRWAVPINGGPAALHREAGAAFSQSMNVGLCAAALAARMPAGRR
eukprot:CAMPEP_0204604900 /NCGR_PEP_ID=MMETSP0661-20131031/58159_1 /ASSEMBLY_ACC=CAM_ASM_000606 /TAXON_ID=109239 /ORGANISM="Alexandrium margalefi, Strain AMGDE01CS-322" /LENGTH=71 /DNA_ID=CAMNT_0051616097 /DNA_START=115 /DNA_END=327 /DNA_ORIENTATION=-